MKKISSKISILLAFLLSGCGGHKWGHERTAEADLHDHEDGPKDAPVEHGVEFKEGKGLSVPASIRDSLGVKIVDVEEGKAARRIELALQVFNTSGAFVLASGNATEKDAEFLVTGSKVVVENESGEIQGEIVSVTKESAKLTGLAEVIVKLPRIDGRRVGSFVTSAVTIANTEDVAVVPKEALLKTAEGYFVYVVNGDSLFRTKVEVGGKDGEVAEITEGLYAGDKVVLQPVMPLWMAELQAIRGGKACADGH